MTAAVSRIAPLAGVRVLNLGGVWAGRVASMLLADQGADVIDIARPGRPQALADAMLDRAKTQITLDFNDVADLAEAAALAATAHIVIDNLGPGRARRFGLDYETLRQQRPGLVYLSLPGFASGSDEQAIAGWEGSINASLGVYTELNANAAVLGDPPIFTAIPMASAYGGVHGATAATLAYLHYLKSGAGQYVEVPLADAVLSAMASLAMRIDGQPAQFDLPRIDKVMTEVAFPIFRDLAAHLSDGHKAMLSTYLKRFARPQFGHHLCADGRQVFINAADHVHQARACLQVLGILDQLVAEGMVVGSPFDEGGDGNNISSSVRLSPLWTGRLGELMAARFLTQPAAHWQTALQHAGVPCSVVNTTDEWLHDPVALEAGCVSIVDDPHFGAVRQAGRFVTIDGERVASPPLSPRRSAARAGWRDTPAPADAPRPLLAGTPGKAILDGVRVLDLSNIIAGPAGARTLAEFGADVIRIDAPAPQAGPRMTMWYGIDVNQGKQAIIVDLKSAAGRHLLRQLVEQADVVVHNFLDRSTADLGISYEQLREINPGIICCQVSAWGGPEGGAWRDYPGFDPVFQAATGITSRYGSIDKPALHGIASCVDYITGFTAALGIAQALVARERGLGGSYVRTSLAMGAQLVQFPFVQHAPGVAPLPVPSGQQAIGSRAGHGLYQSASGWVFLASRSEDHAVVSAALDAGDGTPERLATAIKQRSIGELRALIAVVPQASVVAAARLTSVRVEEPSAATAIRPGYGSHALALATRHPSGYPTALPVPSWFRLSKSPVRRLAPAPAPGTDTRQVLMQLGTGGEEINALFAGGVVRDSWQALKHYLPR